MNVQVLLSAGNAAFEQLSLRIVYWLLAASGPNVTAELLVFFTVMVWAALVPPLVVVKVRLVLLREMGLYKAAALEVSFTTSGKPPGTSSQTMMAPSSVADEGVTCTVTVQLLCGASGVPKQVPGSIW